MQTYRDPRREQHRKLEEFKGYFQQMVSDGHYPPERQQWLFQWCQYHGLDWTTARRGVNAEAQAYVRDIARRMLDVAPLTNEDRADLGQLRRRLALSDAELDQAIQQAHGGRRRDGLRSGLQRARRGVEVVYVSSQIVFVTLVLLATCGAICVGLYYFALAFQAMPR